MLICTISTLNHLPKAACLAGSLRDTQPDHARLLCLVERDGAKVGKLGEGFTNVVLASELNLPGFDSLMFRYVGLEACMALKPCILQWAMKEFSNEDLFLYMDADTFAYSRFEELEFILPKAEV